MTREKAIAIEREYLNLLSLSLPTVEDVWDADAWMEQQLIMGEKYRLALLSRDTKSALGFCAVSPTQKVVFVP